MIKWRSGSKAARTKTQAEKCKEKVQHIQNVAAEGKKRDDAVRALDGWNLETMKRFIMRLAILRGRHLWRNKAAGDTSGILF